MNHRDAGAYWEGNAETWTTLTRAGCDIYRDHFNTPAFLAMLPNISGLKGLDIGCGEGHNTRLLADLGARVTAVDIAETFIRHAREEEQRQPREIDFLTASAVELPFEESQFDFATAFMSLMEFPETDRALAEAYRVIKPGGFLQFSITHPCFDTMHRRNLRDTRGKTYAIEVGRYFQDPAGAIEEWIFNAAPLSLKFTLPKFRVPRFRRTVSQWINLLLETGFQIERMNEPCPTDAQVEAVPGLQDAQIVAYFLHIRARKPFGS